MSVDESCCICGAVGACIDCICADCHMVNFWDDLGVSPDDPRRVAFQSPSVLPPLVLDLRNPLSDVISQVNVALSNVGRDPQPSNLDNLPLDLSIPAPSGDPERFVLTAEVFGSARASVYVNPDQVEVCLPEWSGRMDRADSVSEIDALIKFLQDARTRIQGGA